VLHGWSGVPASTRRTSRQADDARGRERRDPAALEELARHELADEPGRDALLARREDAALDGACDVLGRLARKLGLVHEGRDDAALAPVGDALALAHADGRAQRVRAVHAQRRAHARAPVAVQDVGLGHGAAAELHQRALDQVLDRLDVRDRGFAGGLARRADALDERELDDARDLAREARVGLARGLERLRHRVGDLLALEGHHAPIALAHELEARARRGDRSRRRRIRGGPVTRAHARLSARP
jgi:hypothetical protein